MTKTTKHKYKKIGEAILEMIVIRIETKKMKSKYEILGTELQMYFDLIQEKLEKAEKNLLRFAELQKKIDRKDEKNG